MNDFLKNLRSSQKKETPGTRKNQTGSYYSEPDRRMNRDRRMTYPNTMETASWQNRDIMPEVLEHMASLSENVERLVNAQETLMEAQIEQHHAVTRFFNTLDTMLNRDTTTTANPEDHPPKTTTSYASGTRYTKDEIMGMIHEMRTQGATFSMIADHLKQKNIPTFSGRGEWHAQTIHRLCR